MKTISWKHILKDLNGRHVKEGLNLACGDLLLEWIF